MAEDNDGDSKINVLGSINKLPRISEQLQALDTGKQLRNCVPATGDQVKLLLVAAFLEV